MVIQLGGQNVNILASSAPDVNINITVGNVSTQMFNRVYIAICT